LIAVAIHTHTDCTLSQKGTPTLLIEALGSSTA